MTQQDINNRLHDVLGPLPADGGQHLRYRLAQGWVYVVVNRGSHQRCWFELPSADVRSVFATVGAHLCT